MALLKVHRPLCSYFADVISVNDLTPFGHVLVKLGAPRCRYAVVKRVHVECMDESVTRRNGAVRKLSHSALPQKTFAPSQRFASPFNFNHVFPQGRSYSKRGKTHA